MGIRGIKGLVCGMLALSMVVLSVANTLSADDKEANNQAIIDVADGKAMAKAVAAKIGTEDVMRAFKPRAKGGIGLGKAGASVKDSIELKINALGGKKPITADDLAKESADIARMGEITRAIAEITEHQVPAKNADAWKKYSKDMIQASKDLSAAAAKGTPADVTKAAKKVASSCNDCHSKFRDN